MELEKKEKNSELDNLLDEYRAIKCHKCGYTWQTKSQKIRASCPNCGDGVVITKNLIKR